MESIIYVTSRRLLPLDSGDKILTYNIIKRLSKIYDIYLFNYNKESKYTKEEILKINDISTKFKTVELINLSRMKYFLKILKVILFNKRYAGNFDERYKQDLKKFLDSNLNAKYIVWDHERSSSFFSSNKFINVLIEHNNEANTMEGRIKKFNNPLIKSLIRKQVQHNKRYIKSNHKRMDRIIYLNDNDFSDESQRQPNKYVLMDKLLIDFEHSSYNLTKNSKKIKLLFVGSLDWYPNIDAIEWFLDKIFPILKNKDLYHFDVVGRNPSKKLMQKINTLSNVTLYSNVPSIEEYYLNTDIVVIPIRSGSGINIKVLEALSYGIPIVMTTFAMRGYDGLNFIQGADTPELFSDNINKLMDINNRKNLFEKELLYYDTYQENSSETLKSIFDI